MDQFSLAGRTALITGASRGIGFAIAEALARAGAAVILNGRTPASLHEAAERLRASGAQVHTSAFDVTNPGQVAKAVDTLESSVAPIDILVNNAGIQFRAPLESFDDDNWRKLMVTNLDGVYYLSKA